MSDALWIALIGMAGTVLGAVIAKLKPVQVRPNAPRWQLTLAVVSSGLSLTALAVACVSALAERRVIEYPTPLIPQVVVASVGREIDDRVQWSEPVIVNGFVTGVLEATKDVPNNFTVRLAVLVKPVNSRSSEIRGVAAIQGNAGAQTIYNDGNSFMVPIVKGERYAVVVRPSGATDTMGTHGLYECRAAWTAIAND